MAPLALLLLVAATSLPSASALARKAGLENAPHVLVIVADDMGWNDVGRHSRTQYDKKSNAQRVCAVAAAHNGLALGSRREAAFAACLQRTLPATRTKPSAAEAAKRG